MNETIAAVSTPWGRGGIAVIRISGASAVETAAGLFRPAGGKALCELEPGRTVYGAIFADGRQIDDGMCTVFRAPRSYTGEDTVEISCHGGILLTEKVLAAAFACGAVQAGPGEFTRRAFVNGKLSLSQAEAVGMLIDAENEEQLALAGSHERGVFRKKADELYERLKTVVTSVYANVDFPDEELAEMSEEELLDELDVLISELKTLSDSYRTAKAVCEGIRTVIAGKPNTGKSSLLNRLTGRERAIVTDIAGTTRDTIEESVTLGRVLLRLCDTAGIRETDDAVEKIGVGRALDELENAELVLAVFDRSRPADRDDEELIERLQKQNVPVIAVLNKSDLVPADADFTNAGAAFDESAVSFASAVIEISAKTGDGAERLSEAVNRLFLDGTIDYDTQATVLNARQCASVRRALEAVRRAKTTLASGFSSDTAGFDLEEALSELGELDGRRVTEEIVDGIFHHFCVGK